MGEVLAFTLTAMANPTLITITTLILILPSPRKLMLAYLAGALLTSITLGLVIVFGAEDSGVVKSGKHTINPAVDLALGGLLLVIAVVLHSGRDRSIRERRAARKARGGDEKVPRWKRALSNGNPKLAFVVGMVMTLPGASYLAALTSLSKLHYSTAATVLVVVLINVVMLALIEVPLVGFAVAPKATPAAIERVKAWFRAKGRTALVVGATIVGSLLILRGVIELIG